ncbi:hypothetical protein FRB90_011419 [Tulasnella sp. 427]|nr:hypothetical protein FRB90_011419 [Tulasnella sp. 427]
MDENAEQLLLAVDADGFGPAPFDKTSDGDCILQTSDGVKYKAHRVILSLASPVFRDMWELGVDDEEVPIVHLTESSKVIHTLLRHLYPTTTPWVNDSDTALKLVDAFEKYIIDTKSFLRYLFGVLRCCDYGGPQEEVLTAYCLAWRLNLQIQCQDAAGWLHKIDLARPGLLQEIERKAGDVRALLALWDLRYRRELALDRFLQHFPLDVFRCPDHLKLSLEETGRLRRNIRERFAGPWLDEKLSISECLHQYPPVNSEELSLGSDRRNHAVAIRGTRSSSTAGVQQMPSNSCQACKTKLEQSQQQGLDSMDRMAGTEWEVPRRILCSNMNTPAAPAPAPAPANVPTPAPASPPTPAPAPVFGGFGSPSSTGDCIIKASDKVMFKAHRIILQLASPVWKDMFDTPQPSAKNQPSNAKTPDLPIIELSELSSVLEPLLQLMYPISKSQITSFDLALKLAISYEKYKIDVSTLMPYLNELLSGTLAQGNPIETYGLAWRLKKSEIVAAASRRLHLISLEKKETKDKLLQYSGHYNSIIALHELAHRRELALDDFISNLPLWKYRCPQHVNLSSVETRKLRVNVRQALGTANPHCSDFVRFFNLREVYPSSTLTPASSTLNTAAPPPTLFGGKVGSSASGPITAPANGGQASKPLACTACEDVLKQPKADPGVKDGLESSHATPRKRDQTGAVLILHYSDAQHQSYITETYAATASHIILFRREADPASQVPEPDPKKVTVKTLRENIYTIPNFLTLTRIAACPVLGWSIVTGNFELATGLVVYAGLTDLIDGWLARRFNMGSVLGSILDPAADKLLMTTLTVSLGMNGLLPLPLAVIIIGRDVLLGISAFYWRYISLPPPKTFTRYWDFSIPSAEVHPTTISKYNTALQLVLMTGTVFNQVIPYDLDLPLQGLQWIVAGTTIWSGMSYIWSKDAVKIVASKTLPKP